MLNWNHMATQKQETGVQQASKPKKLLKGNVDPAVGKDTQFKPGQSGNPDGPKPGFKHISTYVQELLNDPDFEGWAFNGRAYEQFKGIPAKAIVKAQAIKALSGDTKAFDSLVKAGYGTKVELTGAGGEPLVLPVVRIIDERPGNPRPRRIRKAA